MIDWTLPVSLAVFFVGLIATVLIGLPRVRAAHQLREMVKAVGGRARDVAEDLSTFKQKDFAILKAKADETAKELQTLKTAFAMKQVGRQ